MTRPAIVFAGTPDFALASLKALVDGGHPPVAVYTQPDRPAGRGKKLKQSPVKQYANEHEIPVLQPRTLRDEGAADTLRAFEPDLLVVAAYGLLLPQDILDVPRHGCLNVHASILPRWRGAAPIQAAILAGDTETGISLMQMEAGLDTGPVFVSEAVRIEPDDTAGVLHDRLATLGGDLLVRHIDEIAAGTLEAQVQDEACATYAGKVSTADAELDWRESAETLARKVRAFNPVPGSFFIVDGRRVKCWQAQTVDDAAGEPGEVIEVSKAGVLVACGHGGLLLEELQRAGKGRVMAHQLADAMNLSDQNFST
ncbi:MAG: methionyl-tRNA formyltransferase [Woeseiaceae bacterium]|nr:methionyl-tRNA formyltransferase [Woeseiaceae bacterium]